MHTLLRRIQLGIGAGTAIYAASAGCSASVMRAGSDAEVDQDARTISDAANDARIHDAGHDTGFVDAAIDAAQRDATTVDAGNFPTYDPALIGCDFSEGPYSWCCHQAVCVAGDPAHCPPAVAEVVPSDVYFDPTCRFEGPYAPNPASPPSRPGDCCYIVGGRAIEGRPLFVDAGMIVAPIVASSAWSIV